MNEGKVLVEGDAEHRARATPEVQRVYIGSGTGRMRKRASRPSSAIGAPLLRVAGINTFYGKSHILHDVSFEVRGERGRCAAGAQRRGQVLHLQEHHRHRAAAHRHGRPWRAARSAGMAPEQIARLGVGLVPQGRRLFAGLTVEENLRLGALSRSRGTGVRWDRDRIYSYFPRIRDKLATKADQLSGGEQQMVAIARALSGNVRDPAAG